MNEPDNPIFRKLISEGNPEVKAVFNKYPAYNPITRATPAFSSEGQGGQANANADAPNMKYFIEWANNKINNSQVKQ